MSILKKRIPTIIGLLVLFSGVFGGIYLVNSRKTSVDESSLTPVNVRITNVADNKFSVSWTTPSSSPAKILYGKVGEALSSEAHDDRDTLSSEQASYLTHHVTVKDLQPNTQYAFRIAAGEKSVQFDNNGTPYTVNTGLVLTATPPAETVYGEAQQSSTLPADGSLVYVEIPGAVALSTLVKSSGSWTVPLSIARTIDLSSYAIYDSKNTQINITINNGRQRSTASILITNSSPVPTMVLGQSYDFSTIPVASLDDTGEATDSGDLIADVPETPGIFNIDSLGDIATASGEVTILNPEEEGEIISTSLPEFRGTGEEGLVLEITVESLPTYTDTIAVDTDGTWAWSPPADLDSGEHTITIAYLDTSGIERILRRTFVVEASEGLPSFEATPSASVAPSTSSASASPSASPRVSVPSTGSGVPVSGVFGPTIMTAVLGILVIVMGGFLLVL